MFSKYGLPLVALAAFAFATAHVIKAQHVPPPLSPPVEPARSPFGKGVSGAGLVEPNTEIISVGSHLSGVVEQVLVKVGDKVAAGQPLFRLDTRAQKEEVRVRRAAVASAKAQLVKLEMQPRPEEVPAMEARLAEARATLVEKDDQLRRTTRLTRDRVVSDEARVAAEQAVQVAKEQLRRADADLKLMKAGAWKPDLTIQSAAVDMAKAQLAQAETELARLSMTAPVAGHVLQVNVRPGEYVSATAGKALIVTGNIEPLHVRVDIDEHDIPRYDSGAEAKAMLRGDPRQEFRLVFVRVEPYVIPKKSLTGDNTERVDTRVLQAIYRVVPGQRMLYVGQQVDVYIAGRSG
jgi:multidrug resistance efflux pump